LETRSAVGGNATPIRTASLLSTEAQPQCSNARRPASDSSTVLYGAATMLAVVLCLLVHDKGQKLLLRLVIERPTASFFVHCSSQSWSNMAVMTPIPDFQLRVHLRKLYTYPNLTLQHHPTLQKAYTGWSCACPIARRPLRNPHEILCITSRPKAFLSLYQCCSSQSLRRAVPTSSAEEAGTAELRSLFSHAHHGSLMWLEKGVVDRRGLSTHEGDSHLRMRRQA